jgi:hypothetical protein
MRHLALLGLWLLVSPRVVHFTGVQSDAIWCAWLAFGTCWIP